MKINIKKSNCYFRVDEKNRKVVCVYTPDPDLIAEYISDFNDEFGLPTFLPTSEDMYLPLHIVGVATCAEGDIWDEEIGREVAFIKMKNKFCTLFFRAMTAYFKFHDKILNKIESSCNALGATWAVNLQNRKEHVEKRLHELNHED